MTDPKPNVRVSEPTAQDVERAAKWLTNSRIQVNRFDADMALKALTPSLAALLCSVRESEREKGWMAGTQAQRDRDNETRAHWKSDNVMCMGPLAPYRTKPRTEEGE